MRRNQQKVKNKIVKFTKALLTVRWGTRAGRAKWKFHISVSAEYI